MWLSSEDKPFVIIEYLFKHKGKILWLDASLGIQKTSTILS